MPIAASEIVTFAANVFNAFDGVCIAIENFDPNRHQRSSEISWHQKICLSSKKPNTKCILDSPLGLYQRIRQHIPCVRTYSNVGKRLQGGKCVWSSAMASGSDEMKKCVSLPRLLLLFLWLLSSSMILPKIIRCDVWPTTLCSWILRMTLGMFDHSH